MKPRKPIEKVVCEDRDCKWHGTDDHALRAKSPFSDDMLIACPKCKQVWSLQVACDESMCWQIATCGTPTNDGYRRTCGKHVPKVGT